MKEVLRKVYLLFTRKDFIRIILVSIGILVFSSSLFLFLPYIIPNNLGTIEVTIERGATPEEIAALLKKKSIIRGERNFLWGAKFLGVTRKLQAGKYSFHGRITNYSVLRKLSKGEVVTEKITFPEGIRATRIANILQRRLEVDSTRFMKLVTDPSFCHSLGINAPTLEGYLYPDTYRFDLNPTPEKIIKRMVSRFYEIFTDSLRERAKQLGMSIHQVVTLASIVEGEAALDSERTTIAALYMNRLRRKMLLQADPTIQYIIKGGPRRLLKTDLKINSPYNTYIHAGLPPGPVNNPGLASILAVLFPVHVNYLYMVANGDGSHTFSKTIHDHLKAKHRLDIIRREIRHYR